MLSHFVAVCLALLPFAQCMEIHEHMTEKEVSKTFQTGHDNVPGYEVVRIYHTLHKRDILDDSTRMVKLNTINRNISLNLEPNKGLLVGESTPVWTVVEHVGWPDGTKYWRDREVLANIGKAYHDVSKRSAIVAYEGEDGETLIHGSLLENLIVRPLPYRLHNTILRERRDLVDLLPDGVDGNTDFRRSHYHVVFKRPERDINATHDGIRVVEREKRVSRDSPTDDPSKASIPDIIYPEILIIVDFRLYEFIANNVQEAVQHVLVVWNSIDLRYRLLEKPAIRLNIAGIIISLQPRGTPYLENARLGGTVIDADQSIKAMGRYFYTESHRFPFDSYDFAVALTHFNMISLGKPIYGVSYPAGACTRNNLEMTTTAVAIIEEPGRLIDIVSATEEIANLMRVHRNRTENSKDGTAEEEHRCMFYRNNLDNTWKSSPYSLKELYAFLSAPESICLRNEPRGGKALPRKLLGELTTVNQQCKTALGPTLIARYSDERVCSQLSCYEPIRHDEYAMGPALEGTPCGDGKYCMNGSCVS